MKMIVDAEIENASNFSAFFKTKNKCEHLTSRINQIICRN